MTRESKKKKADNFLTTKEAAQKIGMSESWLKKARENGSPGAPRHVRNGSRAVRYRLSDLEKYMAEKEVMK